jgi:ABC-type Fe3+/spermidine/putrescine transport system ATPase subunit
LGIRLGITCLLVSHDAADTLSWADEVLVLRRGQLVQQGSPTLLYNQPVDEYTAALFGDYNLVRGNDRMALASHGPSTQPLLVRPEHFRLERASAGTLSGVVRAVRFFGSYYEVEVMLPENVVRVRVSTPTVVPGDVVGVAVRAANTWAIA